MGHPEKPTILLVDDESEILYSLRGLLRREFEVLTALGGEEALRVLEREPVEVVMSDQRMPGMSGVELLGRVRTTCPGVIRLLYTGYADIRAVIDAINLGHVYRYITKPWEPEELFALLHDASRQHRQARSQRELLEEVQTSCAEVRSYLDEQADTVNQDRGRRARRLAERLDVLLERLAERS